MKSELNWTRSTIIAVLSLGMVALGGLSFPTVALAKQKIRVLNGPGPLLIRGGLQAINSASNDEDEIIDGATLKTDPELESTLQRAERYRLDGNYFVATQLWQSVLRQSGDALFSTDNKTYFSLVQQVERIIASLPPDGLEKYRNMADASAKEILAQAKGEYDIDALNQVVREYFISSLGDDAAFKLGSIYLDRFDFIGARRMFEKIVRQYPDPSIPMDQILTRIALCQSFMGDTESATATLEQAMEFAKSETTAMQNVRESLGKITATNETSRVSGDWLMRMGNSRRYGVMPSLPNGFTDSDLVAKWQFYVDPRDRYSKSSDAEGKFIVAQKFDEKIIRNTQTSTETKLLKRWNDQAWRPAGHLLLDNNKMYFKAPADLVAFDLNQIRKAPEDSDAATRVLWKSLWRNSFMEDDATRMMAQIRKSWSGYAQRQQVNFATDAPSTRPEVQLFGDEIHQQMSIHNGILYSIEGHRFDTTNDAPNQPVTPQWNATFRRTRSNYLTAYDAETGMVQWRLPRAVTEKPGENNIVDEETESPWLESGGMMSAPIGYGEMILTAVNQGGSISIYAIDPLQEGKTIWKSFLCDEPDTSASPWSPINLSIDGSDLFVTCGMGVVFVLDPATGLVRYAKRYEREGAVDVSFKRLGWNNNRKVYRGWSEDVVIPYGREMICFSSDTQQIEAFDRNTGETIWKNSMSPREYRIDYLLGIYDDKMFAAGPETVVAFDLQGEGLMIWGGEQAFGGQLSKGRGMLTPDGIYIPVENAIYKISLDGNKSNVKIVDKVGVNFGTHAPVGNLFSDGKIIWAHGGTRVYGLWPDDSIDKNEETDNPEPESKDDSKKTEKGDR